VRRLVIAFILLSPLSDDAFAQSSPGPTEPELAQAAQLADSHQLGKALEAYKALEKKYRGCDLCRIGEGTVHFRAGEAQRALDIFTEVIKHSADPKHRAVARKLKADLLSNLAQKDLKQQKKAEDELRQALAEDPSEPALHLSLGIALLREGRDADGKAELEEFLKRSPADGRADLAREYIADPRRAREAFAPEFKIKTLAGDVVQLKDLHKIVVLDFWATWCPPCRASVPELKDLLKKYPEKVVLISISADDDDQKWRDYIAKNDMRWHHTRDANEVLRNAYSVHAFPTYYVIDSEGIIQRRIVGENPQMSVAGQIKGVLKELKELQ